jgi:hypothetical protein
VTVDAASVYLRQSGVRLARLCRKYFHIEGDGDHLRVERPVTNRDVIGFFEEYGAAIRPHGLSPIKVLPSQSSALRTFLWARPATDSILNDVVRLSLYSDQVVIVDPFSKHVAGWRYQPGIRGPMNEPGLWIQTLVNWGVLVCALEPWIAADFVALVPEPANFIPGVPHFEELARRALKDGTYARDLTPDVVQDMLVAAAFTSRDEAELRQVLRLTLGEISDTELEEIAEALRRYQEAHPRRYVPSDPKQGALISHGSGQNIYEASWIAEQIGGFLVPRGATHVSMSGT